MPPDEDVMFDPFGADDDVDDEEETEEVPEPQPDPVAVRELASLREFKAAAEAEKRAAAVEAAFEEAGLPTKAARLFDALHPDTEPTVESAKAFADEFGLPVSKPKDKQGFSPTSLSRADTSVGPARTWTKEEFESGMRVAPALWQRRWEDGKVERQRRPVEGGRR